jgi:ribosomal protein S18 acetylase RimI-like enzyme
MNENVTVRRASADDINCLADLAARSFRDTFEEHNDPANIDDYLRSSLTTESVCSEFGDAHNIFLVACIDNIDTPAGYAKLITASQDPNVIDQRAVEIERIYADKPVIGRGVGAALMRACVTEAENLRCQAIWLGVWERNERAIRFYERWEFEIVGERQFTLGADLQTDLVMVRKL